MASTLTSESVYRRHSIRHSRQFRILELHPSAERNIAPLHAGLTVSTLDSERGNYETISYVWGDLNIPKTVICVDGTPMHITPSLDAVLRYLRKPDQVLRIWADAICINQDDNEEKAHQVQLMGPIYEECSQVHVWLPSPLQTGHCARSAERLIGLGGLMECFGQEHFHSMPGYTFDPTTNQRSFQETLEFQALWDGFVLLADSPWWTRAWTAQEAFLPPRVLFHHDQGKPCDMRVLFDACNRNWAKGIHHRQCCAEALDLFPPHKIEKIRKFWARVKIIQRCWNGRRGSRPSESFYETVNRFAPRRCSLARDRIYSLWSMAGSLYKRHHSPDYSRSDDEVFTSVFKCMLLESQARADYKFSWGMDFRVLQGTHFGPSPANEHSKRPSWVPNYASANFDVHVFWPGLSRMYQASGWLRGKVEVRGQELHLQGFFIDRLRAVGPVVTDPRDRTLFNRVLMLWKQMLQMHGLGGETQLQGNIPYERIAALFCAGAYREELPDAEMAAWRWKFIFANLWKVNIVHLLFRVDLQYKARHQQWRPYWAEKDFPGVEPLARLFESGDLGCLEDKYGESIEHALEGRALYITDNGRMGLGAPHIQVGDEVWGVYGATVPFVLRPSKERDSNGKALYHMVGDCFLENAMNGELAPSRWQAKKTLITLV